VPGATEVVTPSSAFSNCGPQTTGGFSGSPDDPWRSAGGFQKKKALQKEYQTLKELKKQPYTFVIKVPLLVDL